MKDQDPKALGHKRDTESCWEKTSDVYTQNKENKWHYSENDEEQERQEELKLEKNINSKDDRRLQKWSDI